MQRPWYDNIQQSRWRNKKCNTECQLLAASRAHAWRSACAALSFIWIWKIAWIFYFLANFHFAIIPDNIVCDCSTVHGLARVISLIGQRLALSTFLSSCSSTLAWGPQATSVIIDNWQSAIAQTRRAQHCEARNKLPPPCYVYCSPGQAQFYFSLAFNFIFPFRPILSAQGLR